MHGRHCSVFLNTVNKAKLVEGIREMIHTSYIYIYVCVRVFV